MPKRVLDTNVLINHWRDCLLKRRLHDIRTRDAQKWARELIDIHDSDAIVTPVYIEFVAGQGSHREMNLARAYLGEFDIIDEGHISDKDWERATEIAERVPRDGLRRQLGDCLIRAICDRLHMKFKPVRSVSRTDVWAASRLSEENGAVSAGLNRRLVMGPAAGPGCGRE